MSTKCTDCDGTGEYVGLTSREMCATCEGRGVVPSLMKATEYKITYPVGKDDIEGIHQGTAGQIAGGVRHKPKLEVGSCIRILGANGLTKDFATVTKITDAYIECEIYDDSSGRRGPSCTYEIERVSFSDSHYMYVVDTK